MNETLWKIPLKFKSINQSINYLQDRAKIQTKRRPPSRVARKRASAQSPDSSSDDFFTPTSPVDIDFDTSRMPPPLSGEDFSYRE